MNKDFDYHTDPRWLLPQRPTLATFLLRGNISRNVIRPVPRAKLASISRKIAAIFPFAVLFMVAPGVHGQTSGKVVTPIDSPDPQVAEATGTRDRRRQSSSSPLPSVITELPYSVLIAKGRAALFQTLLDGEYSDPEGRNYGWGGQQGKLLGYVRTGFLIRSTGYGWQDGLTAILPVPLASEPIAWLHQSEVVAFNELVRKAIRPNAKVDVFGTRPDIRKFEIYPVTPNAELLDPFEGKEIILSNAQGSILEVYRSDYRDRNGTLGIAKTSAGYFLGYLREKSALGPSRYSWEQIRTEKKWRFFLRNGQKKSLRKGTRVFRLASFNKAQRQAVVSTDPARIQIKPIHYERLLQIGLERLHAELKAPTDAGFEEEVKADESDTSTQSGYYRYVEVVPEFIMVNFLDWSEQATTLEVAFKKKERVIETWINGRTILRTQTSPWKNITIKDTKTLENDLDGTIRLTDGEAIYEISRRGFNPELQTYTVEENPFYR